MYIPLIKVTFFYLEGGGVDLLISISYHYVLSRFRLNYADVPFLDVQLPHDPSFLSVGRLVDSLFRRVSVCHRFLKGQEVTLTCFYLSTCLLKCYAML